MMDLLRLIVNSCLMLIPWVILYLFYIYQKRAHYFRKNGIPHLHSGILRTIQFLIGTKSSVEFEKEVYQEVLEMDSPIVGMSSLFGLSQVYVTDLDLIKNIYVKDFDHFTNRKPTETTKSNKYFRKMLFSLDDDHWKGVRAKLSPSFTSGKIRKMFQIFKLSSERMSNYLKRQMDYPNKNSVEIDFLQIFSKYPIDVIASCVFGIDSKSFDVEPNQKSYFEQMAGKYGFRLNLRALTVLILPKVADYFGLDLFDQESQNYFCNAIRDVMKRRRESGERREDFLQLMMDVQQGLLKEDEESNEVMNGLTNEEIGNDSILKGGKYQEKLVFDDEDIIASSLTFLMAGFDPTQSVLLFILYALALETEVQEKLYLEVKSVLGKSENGLSYEAIMEMSYLDMVLNESMRRYTPAIFTHRHCDKDYLVPGTDFVIKKGMQAFIPITGVHQDSRYFPEPDKFIPERFSNEGKASRHPYAFMPFGHGPRNCIGMRFGLVQVKAVIAQLVYNFQFEPCSKTQIPMKFDRSPNVKPKGGMWLNVIARENDGDK